MTVPSVSRLLLMKLPSMRWFLFTSACSTRQWSGGQQQAVENGQQQQQQQRGGSQQMRTGAGR
jgi:hypothetical protein